MLPARVVGTKMEALGDSGLLSAPRLCVTTATTGVGGAPVRIGVVHRVTSSMPLSGVAGVYATTTWSMNWGNA
jgi:hypothetical protein